MLIIIFLVGNNFTIEALTLNGQKHIFASLISLQIPQLFLATPHVEHGISSSITAPRVYWTIRSINLVMRANLVDLRKGLHGVCSSQTCIVFHERFHHILQDCAEPAILYLLSPYTIQSSSRYTQMNFIFSIKQIQLYWLHAILSYFTDIKLKSPIMSWYFCTSNRTN